MSNRTLTIIALIAIVAVIVVVVRNNKLQREQAGSYGAPDSGWAGTGVGSSYDGGGTDRYTPPSSSDDDSWSMGDYTQAFTCATMPWTCVSYFWW